MLRNYAQSNFVFDPSSIAGFKRRYLYLAALITARLEAISEGEFRNTLLSLDVGLCPLSLSMHSDSLLQLAVVTISSLGNTGWRL